MRNITSSLSENVHALQSGDPVVFLAEIQVPTDPATRYRLTTHTEDLEFGFDSTGTPVTYSRFPIAFDSIALDAEGSIPIINFSIGSIDEAFASTLYTHRGMAGQPAVLRFILLSDADQTNAQIRFDGKIRSVSIEEKGMGFSVSVTNLYERELPSRRYLSRRCRVRVFGDFECGYDTSTAGQPGGANFTECGRTLSQCEERGDDEVARGLVRKHPQRFGAEPGMNRR